MGMLEEVATWLDAQSTRLTSGTSLFAGSLPVTAGVALGLFEPPGTEPQWTQGAGALPAWEQRSLQLIARSTQPANGATIPDPTVARATITEAYRKLNTITNSTALGRLYLRIDARQSPFQLPEPEDDGRILFSVNFDVWRVPSTSD